MRYYLYDVIFSRVKRVDIFGKPVDKQIQYWDGMNMPSQSLLIGEGGAPSGILSTNILSPENTAINLEKFLTGNDPHFSVSSAIKFNSKPTIINNIPQRDLPTNDFTAPIHALSIINIPSEEDKLEEAIPNEKVLQMTYLESYAVKHLDGYMNKKRNNDILNKYEKIMYHVNSLYVNLHIEETMISLVKDNQTLPLRIDGVDYKDIKSFHVTPVPFTIPIMTFLPLDY